MTNLVMTTTTTTTTNGFHKNKKTVVFTEEDDKILIEERFGKHKTWEDVSSHPHFKSKGISAKQLSHRMSTLKGAAGNNVLKSDTRVDDFRPHQSIFTYEEEQELIRQQSIHGNKWTFIARHCKILSKFTYKQLAKRWESLKDMEESATSVGFKKPWTTKETNALLAQIKRHRYNGRINWRLVANHPDLSNRCKVQIKIKWKHMLKRNEKEIASSLMIDRNKTKGGENKTVKSKQDVIAYCPESGTKTTTSNSTPHLESRAESQPSKYASWRNDYYSSLIDNSDDERNIRTAIPFTVKIVLATSSCTKREWHREFELGNDNSYEGILLSNALRGRLWNIQHNVEAFI